MAKKETRPGEGDQGQQEDYQLARRDKTPLVPTKDTGGGKPRAVLLAELEEESEEILYEGDDVDIVLKKTVIRFRNITPDILSEKDKDGKTSEPSDS